MSQSHRRAYLFGIFHYRQPEARARRLANMIDEMLGRKPEPGNEQNFSESV
jgi:hypothetical protein